MVKLHLIDPDDTDALAACLRVQEAARAADSAWEPLTTLAVVRVVKRRTCSRTSGRGS